MKRCLKKYSFLDTVAAVYANNTNFTSDAFRLVAVTPPIQYPTSATVYTDIGRAMRLVLRHVVSDHIYHQVPEEEAG